MADIIVKLAALIDIEPVVAEQRAKGINIRQGRTEEQAVIAEWVRENFNANWGMGCEVALEQEPVTCYIAVQENPLFDKQSDMSADKLLGFSCYDVVTKGVLGPTGVLEDYQETGLDTALSLVCLHEMAEQGYEFATIGWTSFIHPQKGI
jgi:ribosomal protein S18 acetylase RimI-like enzyme